MMQLRPYQTEAVEAVYDALRAGPENPCVVLPTGTGKSLVLAKIASDAVQTWGGRVLILAHVKELLEQNADKIRRLAPGLAIGVYSAGLNSRNYNAPVVVAGIQSVYRRACEMGRFDLVIVDEAHLIPVTGDGMYRQFLSDALVVNPDLRVIGLTATPYRLAGGEICAPGNILHRVCYEANIADMISAGYLAPLISRGGVVEADLAGVKRRGGEFVETEMAERFDLPDFIRDAVAEIVELAANRQSVLIFAASVAHAEHVRDALRTAVGADLVAMVTGETASGDRAEILARFRGDSLMPRIKYLVNVNVLTTGFDAPGVDCVVLLRATESTGLYVQIVGRGTRIAPGKTDCLVLDYGGNIVRHGPLDALDPKGKRKSATGGEAPAKKCPDCRMILATAVRVCPGCGYEFPKPEPAIDTTASAAGILCGQITTETLEVSSVSYGIHTKRNDPDAPPTLRVDYAVGSYFPVSEWVCPEHPGYARSKFVAWWRERTAEDVPVDTASAFYAACDGVLREPVQIVVQTKAGEKFSRIVKHIFAPDETTIDGLPDSWEPGQYNKAELDEIPF